MMPSRSSVTMGPGTSFFTHKSVTPSLGATAAYIPHVLGISDLENKLVTSLLRLARSTYRIQPLPKKVSGSANGVYDLIRQRCVWVITSVDGFWKYPGTEGTVLSQYMPSNSAFVFPGHPEDNGLLTMWSAEEESTFGLMLTTLPWLVVKARKDTKSRY